MEGPAAVLVPAFFAVRLPLGRYFGHNVSSGCIRMRNESAVDLFARTPIGTKVIVLATRSVGA
jgi:hypothetical protein